MTTTPRWRAASRWSAAAATVTTASGEAHFTVSVDPTLPLDDPEAFDARVAEQLVPFRVVGTQFTVVPPTVVGLDIALVVFLLPGTSVDGLRADPTAASAPDTYQTASPPTSIPAGSAWGSRSSSATCWRCSRRSTASAGSTPSAAPTLGSASARSRPTSATTSRRASSRLAGGDGPGRQRSGKAGPRPGGLLPRGGRMSDDLDGNCAGPAVALLAALALSGASSSGMLAEIPRVAFRSGVGAQMCLLAALKMRDLDDPTIALIDAWSYVGDIVCFYQERIINEVTPATATEGLSLSLMAQSVGYQPVQFVGAATVLAVTVEEPQPAITGGPPPAP